MHKYDSVEGTQSTYQTSQGDLESRKLPTDWYLHRGLSEVHRRALVTVLAAQDHCEHIRWLGRFSVL